MPANILQFYTRRRRRGREDVSRYSAEIASPIVLVLPSSFVARSRARLAVSSSAPVTAGNILIGGEATPDLVTNQVFFLRNRPVVGRSITVSNAGAGVVSIYVVDGLGVPFLIAQG